MATLVGFIVLLIMAIVVLAQYNHVAKPPQKGVSRTRSQTAFDGNIEAAISIACTRGWVSRYSLTQRGLGKFEAVMVLDTARSRGLFNYNPANRRYYPTNEARRRFRGPIPTPDNTITDITITDITITDIALAAPILATPSPKPRKPPVLSTEVLEAGILAVNGRGVHMAVLYATMLGFKSETLNDENRSEFVRLIQSPPDFTQDGTALAVNRVTQDADVLFKSAHFESYVYGYGGQGDRNAQLKPLIEEYRLVVAEFGAEAVFAAAEFDVAAFIKRTALERREADVTAILSKLEENRRYLARLLMRGDAGFNEFVLKNFLYTHFNKDMDQPALLPHLRFFYNYYPLSICLQLVAPWLGEIKDAGPD